MWLRPSDVPCATHVVVSGLDTVACGQEVLRHLVEYTSLQRDGGTGSAPRLTVEFHSRWRHGWLMLAPLALARNIDALMQRANAAAAAACDDPPLAASLPVESPLLLPHPVTSSKPSMHCTAHRSTKHMPPPVLTPAISRDSLTATPSTATPSTATSSTTTPSTAEEYPQASAAIRYRRTKSPLPPESPSPLPALWGELMATAWGVVRRVRSKEDEMGGG